MNGKLVIAFMILIVMSLAACSNQAPADISTPTLAETLEIPITGATETEAPVTVEVVVTSTNAPEFTSTPEPPRPTNIPDCTNSASFVTDVTIPDNSEIVGNTTFTKT